VERAAGGRAGTGLNPPATPTDQNDNGDDTMIRRRTALIAGAALLAGAANAQPAAEDARSYPSKPIRIIVGYTPGGGTDVLARLAAKELQERLGKPVVVENRPGAGAVPATELVAHAPPDGYTLLMSPSGPLTMTPALRAQMPYQPMKDFVPISMMGLLPFLVAVDASTPFQTLQNVVDHAKANPGKLSYASSGPTFQLVGELLKLRTGTDFTMIPYKSSSESANAVVSRQVTLAIADAPPLAGLVQSGRLRALAYTHTKRSASFPNVPTIAEAGYPGLEVYTWVGLLAPAGTPAAIVKKLEAEMIRAANLPQIRERFLSLGVEPAGTSSEQFGKSIKDETERWAGVVKAANIKLE
jgi:tripartite-type tricarboxylate transporter receptor subunit TctC